MEDLGDLGGRFGRYGLEIWDFWVSDLGDTGQRSGRFGLFPQHEGVSRALHPPRDQFPCSTTTTSMGIRCPDKAGFFFGWKLQAHVLAGGASPLPRALPWAV